MDSVTTTNDANICNDHLVNYNEFLSGNIGLNTNFTGEVRKAAKNEIVVGNLPSPLNGTVTFTMTEKIGGLMFPMYAKMIPSFDQTFEQFASDLEKEAGIIMSKN